LHGGDAEPRFYTAWTQSSHAGRLLLLAQLVRSAIVPRRYEQEKTLPNCDFYAAAGDFEPILQFIFSDLHCRVLEAYSGCDQDLREFSCLDELVKGTNLGEGSLSCFLVLWPVEASDQVRIRRIKLDPSSGLGTHTHVTEGWGLISLQLGGLNKQGLHHSHTNHNTEKRATKWADTQHYMGDPLAWNWNVVTRTSDKLNRRIRSLAVAKVGSRSVLPGAKAAFDLGARAL
jgi:hypothetical protein